MPLKFLKDRFALFPRSRRALRHFRRRLMLESLSTRGKAVPVPAQLTQALRQASEGDAAAVLGRAGSRSAGLSESEADDIRERVGPNEIEHEKPMPAWQHLWVSYRNPFNLLLTALAAISWFTDDIKATVVIASMVVLSTLLRFVQEGRSLREAERLKAMVSNTATVLRQGDDAATSAEVELPIAELVPGDVLVLSAGDMIPADCRVLTAKDLFLSQAAMTGESLPIEKFALAHAAAEAGDSVLDAANLLFMGTNVISGAATALVLTTGNHTYFGTIATRVTSTDRAPTAFQVGVNSVSWLLIRFAAVMVPIVFFLNGYTKGDWGEAFLFALSVAVGLTPEMLPMIVTSTLAKGAVVLSRNKVVVKRLDAIQNFGAMDVLCTDKTGTLTQDKIVLERHTDVDGVPSDAVLKFAFLNSHFQTGLKNLLDRAVLEHVELHTALRVAQDYEKVDEIPFDFDRRRMSVVVSEQGQHHELICKGAVEEILAICSHIQDTDGQVLALDAAMLARVQDVTGTLNQEGLRVVAVAMKEVPPQKIVYGIEDESGLTLVGYIAFLDPPKESTAPALQALAEHGVEVKVLTGDNDLVAAKVCRDVGLPVDSVVLGAQIEDLDEPGLRQLVEKHNLFAKLTPLHKERIVRALRANGHVVGFLGDGINDAPALRASDIGISVDGGVDIAKEAADIHHVGEKPDGAGTRRAGGPQDLQQHAEIHPHDGQLELWQRLLGADCQRLSAVSAHAAAAFAGAKPAVRHLADRHSIRQRR